MKKWVNFSQVGGEFDWGNSCEAYTTNNWQEQPSSHLKERISKSDDASRKQRAAGASSQREALSPIPIPNSISKPNPANC
jgi:hypothetical protein